MHQKWRMWELFNFSFCVFGSDISNHSATSCCKPQL